MKHLTFTAVIIAISLFSFTVYAQNSESKISERKQKDIEKFANEFAKSFDQTKNFNLIPKRFFDKNFKSNLVNFYKTAFSDEFKVFEQLNNEKAYNFFVLGINFFYLGIMINDGLCCEDFRLDKNLPELIKVIRKNKLFLSIYSKNGNDENINDIKITSLKEVDKLAQDLKVISFIQRKYLNYRSENWKRIYQKNMAATRKKFEYSRSFQCSEEECANLPQATEMFDISVFPFILRIVKIGKSFKIVNLFPYTQ